MTRNVSNVTEETDPSLSLGALKVGALCLMCLQTLGARLRHAVEMLWAAQNDGK